MVGGKICGTPGGGRNRDDKLALAPPVRHQPRRAVAEMLPGADGEEHRVLGLVDFGVPYLGESPCAPDHLFAKAPAPLAGNLDDRVRIHLHPRDYRLGCGNRSGHVRFQTARTRLEILENREKRRGSYDCNSHSATAGSAEGPAAYPGGP